ncbi:hypothetical protein [Vibrio fluvialis]|uniref:hypothetical protein n=1 Tax=Vibrio fluvialis TaxID=676 RepID=UPI0018C8A476|nr:hypothetical protein [Vibrio fluvialis]
MSTLQAIPTQYGIDILNSELKSTVTRYQLVGALIHDAPSESLYTFHEDTIETSYYDENGVLTFIINLPIEQHFDEYLHRIDVLDANDQTVIECETPKIALPKGIGGIVTLKAAITGEPGDVVFKHGEYMTETELVEVHLLKYSQSSVTQFLPYDPNRIYQCGEVCYTVTDGKVSYWEWYSNVESLAGKNPLDMTNRQAGWIDDTKPFYWTPYKKARSGTPLWPWMSMSFPEGTLNVTGNSVPAAVFWRLASAFPELVNSTTGMIDFPDTGGEFFRVLDQGRGIDSGRAFSSVQLDAFQGHSRMLRRSGGGSDTVHGQVGVAQGGSYNVPMAQGTGDAWKPGEYNDDGHGTPRVSYETRPRNLAFPILVEV